MYTTQAALSPEVTSKSAPNDDVNSPKMSKEEVTDVKILTEKLGAALLNIGAKEDLVKQHAKVAEEAVSGIYPLALTMHINGNSATSNIYYH